MSVHHAPKRFRGLTLNDMVPRNAHQERALELVWSYFSAWCAGQVPVGRGLTLAGSPGVGKTMLAAALLGSMAEADPGKRFGFTTLHRYIRSLSNEMTLENAMRYGSEDAFEDWREARQLNRDVRNTYEVLVLDDVGKEHRTSSGYVQGEFDFLLRLRYDAGNPTVLTTNLREEDWYRSYSEAMASFLHEAAPVVRVRGADVRARMEGDDE